MMDNYEALIGLPALLAAAPLLTQHLKQFVRAVRDRNNQWDKDATPWPLTCDVLTALLALGAWFSDWIPQEQVDSPLAALLVGLAGSVVIQRGYDVVTGGNGNG